MRVNRSEGGLGCSMMGSAVRLPGIVHVAVAVNDHVAVNVSVNGRG